MLKAIKADNNIESLQMLVTELSDKRNLIQIGVILAPIFSYLQIVFVDIDTDYL